MALPIPAGETGARIVISGEDVPFGAYQALYHHLTKKVEKRTKVYRDAYTVSFGDIQNLHSRLSQLTKQYNVKSSRCQITHRLKDDTSREHSSFERFRLSDCSIRSCTQSINYEFDFLVILPPEIPEAAEIVQRYTINVLLDQDFIDDGNVDVPYFVRNVMFGRNINTSIEYSDYSVSEAIHATLDGWVGTLPQRSPSSLILFLFTTERALRTYASSATRSTVFLMGAVASLNLTSIRDASFLVLMTFCLAFFVFTISDGLIDKFYSGLPLVKPMSSILVTDGDRERQATLASKQRRLGAGLYFLVFGIITTVAISVFSSFLYDSIRHRL